MNRGEIFKKGLNNQITPPKPTVEAHGFRGKGGKKPFNKNHKPGNKPAPAKEAK